MNIKFVLKKLYQRGISVLKEFKGLSSEYSLIFASITLLWWISYYLHFKKANKYFSRLKQKKIDKIIESEFSEIIEKYKDKPESKEEVKDYRIWVFWAQGEGKMPLLVKSCYNQLKNVEGERAILITLKNINEYIDFPDYIYENINKGILTLTHFSDIIRVSLLAKYGGMWYDATCWISQTFPPQFVNEKLFSPHNPKDNTEYVGYAIGTGFIDTILFSFTKEILLGIQKKFNVLPDYLIISYVLHYAFKNINACKKLYDFIPVNNTQRFLLFSWMNKPFNPQKYQDLIKNNWIFKLSYKAHYEEFYDGEPTFYRRLIIGKED